MTLDSPSLALRNNIASSVKNERVIQGQVFLIEKSLIISFCSNFYSFLESTFITRMNKYRERWSLWPNPLSRTISPLLFPLIKIE